MAGQSQLAQRQARGLGRSGCFVRQAIRPTHSASTLQLPHAAEAANGRRLMFFRMFFRLGGSVAGGLGKGGSEGWGVGGWGIGGLGILLKSDGLYLLDLKNMRFL